MCPPTENKFNNNLLYWIHYMHMTQCDLKFEIFVVLIIRILIKLLLIVIHIKDKHDNRYILSFTFIHSHST